MDSGNVIVSRFLLSHASAWTFKNSSGWQSLVANGVLHAICTPPSGASVHLFATHLQCTSAPRQDLPTKEQAVSDENRLPGLVRACYDGGHEAEQRLQQLHELTRFVHSTTGIQGPYIVGGDLNIEGGSNDYYEAAKLFGRHSTNFPDFAPTYSTRSFLTCPGWKDVDWKSNLDYIFTNLDVRAFQVLPFDVSDHLPLHLVVSEPSLPESDSEIDRIGKIMGLCVPVCGLSQCTKIHTTTHHARHSTMGIHDPEHLAIVPLMFQDVPRSQ